MTAQWVKYDGSDEQIAEMIESANGVLIKYKNVDKVSTIHFASVVMKDVIANYTVVEYLICSPHPYADMICQWARTGQPVYAKAISGVGSQECHEYFPPFAHPDKFEYSFTPF